MEASVGRKESALQNGEGLGPSQEWVYASRPSLEQVVIANTQEQELQNQKEILRLLSL